MRCEREIVGEILKKKKKQVRETIERNVGRKFWER